MASTLEAAVWSDELPLESALLSLRPQFVVVTIMLLLLTRMHAPLSTIVLPPSLIAVHALVDVDAMALGTRGGVEERRAGGERGDWGVEVWWYRARE